MNSISQEDIFKIARNLEDHHAIFSKIWQISKVNFCDKIDTACVVFDKNGRFLDFRFNKQFWDSLNLYQRCFIFCHECLHILLNHGERIRLLKPELANIATDLVINEMLINDFNFYRSDLGTIGQEGCFLDTIFPKQNIEKNKSTEFYYNLLDSNLKQLPKTLSIDNHTGLYNNDDANDIKELLEEIISDANSFDTFNFKQKVLDNEEGKICQKAGSVPGSLTKIVKIDNVPVKKKWETVIKNWALSTIKNKDKDVTQWTRTNRRFATINSDLILPSDMEVEDLNKEKNRIKVVFFQDTSGSCSGFIERFFKAAKSMPKDKFDVELYCFDTQVYKTSLESGKLYGFGGTSFSILEDYVWNNIAERKLEKYPKAIFVITDGYGDNIKPALPKTWHWFLSTNDTSCIDKECNIYDLSKFE